MNAQSIGNLRNLNFDGLEIKQWLEEQLNDSTLSDTSAFLFYSNLGDLLSKEKEHQEAIEMLKKGIEIGIELEFESDSIFIDALNDLAYNYIKVGQVKTAERQIRLYIGNEIKSWRYVKLCFYYAECLESLGDLNLAQLHLERALRISEEIENNRYTSRSLARLSRMYLLTSNLEKAKKVDKKLPDYKYLGREDQIMVVKYNIASIYKNNKFYDKAIQAFDEIIFWGEKNNKPQFTLMGNINKASCLRDLKKYSEAIKCFEIAIIIDSTEENIYVNLAEVYLALGDEDSAIYYNEKALNMAGIDLNQYNFDEVFKKKLFRYPYKEYVLLIFHDLARSYIAKAVFQNEEEALVRSNLLFNLMDEMINEIRFSTSEQQSQHFWRNEVKPIYDNAILAAYLSSNIDKAFYFAEKSKAILLLDDLLKNTSVEKGNVPDDLLEKEFILKQEILEIELELNINLSSIKQDSINDILLLKKLELSSLLQEIEVVSPQYVGAKYNQSIESLKNIETKLSSNETLVNFIWAEDHIFRFIIRNKNSTVAKIKINDDFEGAIKDLINSLKKPTTKKNTFITNNEISCKIYQVLLGDANIDSKKVTILPDGILSYLPFEALVISENLEEPKYLIEDKIINYGFSVNTMFISYPKNKNKKVVAFAPQQYLPEMKLEELRFSDFELEPIIQSGAILFEHNSASKQAILENLESSKIIHIYSHAEASDSSNTYPWIAAQDELIFLPELYNYKNNADLVVLSACETSLGKEVKGEGVISLARGFFHSGSKSVLASLWKVNDKSNSEVVHHFYKNLKKGKTKAEALRLSKLEYIKTHVIESRSPYYWAGLVYIGKDGDLAIKKNYNRLNWFLIGLGFLVVSFGLIKFRKT